MSTTEIKETGTLTKFDSNLGTLTGAILTLYGGAQFSMTGTNTAANSQNAKLTSTSDLFFTSSESAVNTTIGSSSISMLYATSNETFTVGETKNFGPVTDEKQLTFNLISILSSVQASGGGTFTITAKSLSGFGLIGGGGNISTTQDTVAGAGASITYTYIPVPEPSSAALLGLGGLALVLRRRK